MRKNKFIPMCLVGSMVLSMNVPVLAADQLNESIYHQELSNVEESDVFYDSYELDEGTMFVKENSEYRIAYIEYNNGDISYSVVYKSNPSVVHEGYYNAEEYNLPNIYSVEPNDSNCDVVDQLLALEPESTIDFSSREVETPTVFANTVLTEADALNCASQWATGWETPVSSKWIGTSFAYPVTVAVYESVLGNCTEKSVVRYYIQDSLTSIVSLLFKLNITKVMNVVTNVFSLGKGYVAQKNGTLTYFEIDNSRTKIATIYGKTQYWSGWDRKYCVYSGDKSTKVEQIYNLCYWDYSNSISYFAQKAYDSYSS